MEICKSSAAVPRLEKLKPRTSIYSFSKLSTPRLSVGLTLERGGSSSKKTSLPHPRLSVALTLERGQNLLETSRSF